MVISYPDLMNQSIDQGESDKLALKIQQMLDSQKKRTNQQILDHAGRKICALLLPKDKNVR